MKLHQAIAATALVLSLPVLARGGSNDSSTQVRGTIDNADSSGGSRHEEFTCFGTPTCVGVHTVTSQPKVCSNGETHTGDVTFTGLELSRPGTFTGGQTVPSRVIHTRNADGTCTYTSGPGATWPLTGSWDGSAGTLSISATHQDGTPRPESGTFTAVDDSTHPVFPMTVTASITPTTSDVSAGVTARPEDDGKSASFFVFAHVPATDLKRAPLGKRVGAAPAIAASETDLPVICVLAQADAQGNLRPVSASSMQPSLTGILSAQSQAVTILANAPTSSVAGATFYVGYGADAASMLAAGVYQAALSVPGAVQCTASLAAAPAPASPGPLTGLWYNASESGWGIHFTQRGSIVFAAWFTYDGAGKPKWYVASACPLPAGTTGASGTCNGTLYEVNGPLFFGAPFDPAAVHAQAAGTLQVAFQDANTASMTYTVGGTTRTVPIVRQVFQSGTTPPAVDYSDLWWNPSESGWGLGVSQQYGMAFLAWFVYDGAGAPMWYVAPACAMAGSRCTGDLYRTIGPPFGPTFDPALVKPFGAGTIQVNFDDANHATLSYTVNGVTSVKTVTRQLF